MTDEAGDEVPETTEDDSEVDAKENLEAKVAELEKELQYWAAELVHVRQRAARERAEAMR